MKRQKKNRATPAGGVDKQNIKMTLRDEDDTSVNEEDDTSSVNQEDNSVKSKKFGGNGKNKNARIKHRKPRLIVRNLPYKASEDSVRKHFQQFGEVSEVVLLRKPNKQLVGCGFVQFLRNQNAAKAIAHASGRPFLGRPIVVDWAVPKDEYLKKTKGPEADEDVKPEIKEEENDTSSESSECNKQRDFDDEHNEDNDIGGDDDEEDEDEDDDEDDDSFDHKKIKADKFPGTKNSDLTQKQRFESHDVTEGRTIFLRNLPFSVDNHRLKEIGQQFGCVLYAVVCMDPKSDHSRGTGFIKFKDADSVKQCITQAQNKELVIDNRTIDVTLALSRQDANKGKTEKVRKDNRNLYLLKEGLVTAGSAAAEGVSPSDMEKRISLEQWKTRTLRDLTKFVSRFRLVIHNLPPSFTDEQLKELFLKHGGFKPRLKEVRIMRNLKDVDANGVGRSKEHGFVAFDNHENALEALRNLNNNPTIFGPNKRPIVSFSIEDQKMLNIRKRRQERSLVKNPTWKHYKKEGESGTKQNRRGNKKDFEKAKGQKPQTGVKRKNSATDPGPKKAKPFMGAVAKKGEGQTIPMRKLRDQAELVRKNARLEKKKSRQKNRPERIKQAKQPKKDKEATDNFNDMVNKYKSALSSAPAVRSKWYD